MIKDGRFITIHTIMPFFNDKDAQDKLVIDNKIISDYLSEGWMHGGTAYLPIIQSQNFTSVHRYVTLFR